MGDIILDGANWCEHTERRGKELQPRGVSYISMGVSGYYQSARRGSSISPSGDKGVLDKSLCEDGPQWRRALEGISGIVNEAWELLFKCLRTSLDDTSGIFKQWGEEGELRRNFRVNIGADICDGQNGHVVNEIQDTVVQDADDSEGTGVWSVMEAARRHLAAPTISSDHLWSELDRSGELGRKVGRGSGEVHPHGLHHPVSVQGRKAG
ncbi:hypothetical protein BKA93DRAFT_828528 [Sparassis latifolia]